MLAYTEARRASDTPEEFGEGSIDGILASETANNAVTGATLIPLLTFGIPGDNAVAVLLSVLAVVGTFAISNSTFDVMVMLVFGLLGYLMKRFDFPIPPLTIGLVLGYLMEANLRRSLLLSKGSFAIFFTRPVSLLVLLISAAMLAYSLLRPMLKERRSKKG